MSENKHIINLIVGDWSHDGHGQTESILIESNLDYDEIKSAYRKGAELIGFDITHICEDQNDSSIAFKDFKKFVAAGFESIPGEPEDMPDMEDVEFVDMYIEFYVTLYFFTVKKGDPAFKYRNISREALNINIGGYGLFSN